MKKYRISIQGKNFILKIENEVKKLGFYTTRYIQAKTQEEAEKQSLDIIRNELRTSVLNEPSNPPMMYIEKVVEIESFEGISIPGEGFTFYPEIEESK